MVEYLVYGVIGAILLWVVVGALKSKPDFEGSGPTERPDEAQLSERSAAEIEAEARRRFEIPHVTVNDDEQHAYQACVFIRRASIRHRVPARPYPTLTTPRRPKLNGLKLLKLLTAHQVKTGCGLRMLEKHYSKG